MFLNGALDVHFQGMCAEKGKKEMNINFSVSATPPYLPFTVFHPAGTLRVADEPEIALWGKVVTQWK